MYNRYSCKSTTTSAQSRRLTGHQSVRAGRVRTRPARIRLTRRPITRTNRRLRTIPRTTTPIPSPA